MVDDVPTFMELHCCACIAAGGWGGGRGGGGQTEEGARGGSVGFSSIAIQDGNSLVGSCLASGIRPHPQEPLPWHLQR